MDLQEVGGNISEQEFFFPGPPLVASFALLCAGIFVWYTMVHRLAYIPHDQVKRSFVYQIASYFDRDNYDNVMKQSTFIVPWHLSES